MEERNMQIGKSLFGVLIVAAVIFFVLNSPVFVVHPGEVVVKYSRLTGSTKPYSQGAHLRIPFIDGLQKFDVKTLRVDIKADCASKDLQKVLVHTVLNYHLMYEKVNDLFVKVGSDYVAKVIDPLVNEAVKAATALLPVEEVIVKRADLKSAIESNLSKKLLEYNIVLESLNLVDINFSEEFNRVVEQKQIEEQKIKTAEYQKEQAQQYKLKSILEGEAEAEKQRLIKQNVTDNIVSLEWIKKWNGVLPTTVLGEKSTMMMGTK